MTRRLFAAGAATAASVLSLRALSRRGASHLLAAPRFGPGEEDLRPALDALGGEVVRFRSRDGLRLAGRWLPADRSEESWSPDPYEAILLLHGYSGSVAPDLVEFGPFLRRTAGVLGLDFGGHGGSDDAPTTFGLREVEDVAGALAWLGERGVRRVALFGTSMGGIVAIASVVVLGDGSLPAADADPFAPAAPVDPPSPAIVAVVADSVPPELPVAVAGRLRLPTGLLRRVAAHRLFAAAAARLGRDPRETEPIRIVGLVAPTPLLLIHGEADRTVPPGDGRRLADAAGPNAERWTVPGADHSRAHAAAPAAYEARVSEFLRGALLGARDAAGILGAAGAPEAAALGAGASRTRRKKTD